MCLTSHCLPLSSGLSALLSPTTKRPNFFLSFFQPHIYSLLINIQHDHYYYFNSLLTKILLIILFPYTHHLLEIICLRSVCHLQFYLTEKKPYRSALLTRILLCLLNCYAASVPCTAQPPQHRPYIESSSHHHLHPSSSTLSISPLQCRPITTDLSIISLPPRPRIPRPRRIITTVADHEERLGFQLLRTRIARSAEFEA